MYAQRAFVVECHRMGTSCVFAILPKESYSLITWQLSDQPLFSLSFPFGAFPFAIVRPHVMPQCRDGQSVVMVCVEKLPKNFPVTRGHLGTSICTGVPRSASGHSYGQTILHLMLSTCLRSNKPFARML